METSRLDVDLHRLDLRFAGTRLADAAAVERLARSIAGHGQIEPCVAAATGDSFVLIDGYRRVAALRRLGRDRALVEGWACSVTDALIAVMTRNQGRTFTALEEALLIRELMQGSGLSQRELARRCGRDGAWVNRRLALLSALSDEALAAVQRGTLSCWSASRVFVPLARANGKHADRLLAALRKEPLSTRDLGRWFAEYSKASKIARERMVDQPRLLLQALRDQDDRRDGAKLQRGPEGECANDIQIIEAVTARLRKRLVTLGAMPAFLRLGVARLRAAIGALVYEMERCSNEDTERDQTGGAHPGGARQGAARDREGAGAVP